MRLEKGGTAVTMTVWSWALTVIFSRRTPAFPLTLIFLERKRANSAGSRTPSAAGLETSMEKTKGATFTAFFFWTTFLTGALAAGALAAAGAATGVSSGMVEKRKA